MGTYLAVEPVSYVSILYYNQREICPQNDAAAEETPATKPIVGIIYPPPEVRNIVDKTASFVARFVTSLLTYIIFCTAAILTKCILFS